MGLRPIAWMVIGAVAAFTFAACAGLAFNYPYYALDLKEQKLMGDKPADDLPITVCLQGADNHYPCVTVKSDVFFRIKRDYLELSDRLKACEGAK